MDLLRASLRHLLQQQVSLGAREMGRESGARTPGPTAPTPTAGEGDTELLQTPGPTACLRGMGAGEEAGESTNAWREM